MVPTGRSREVAGVVEADYVEDFTAAADLVAPAVYGMFSQRVLPTLEETEQPLADALDVVLRYGGSDAADSARTQVAAMENEIGRLPEAVVLGVTGMGGRGSVTDKVDRYVSQSKEAFRSMLPRVPESERETLRRGIQAVVDVSSTIRPAVNAAYREFGPAPEEDEQ